jgi:hypothetical protein
MSPRGSRPSVCDFVPSRHFQLFDGVLLLYREVRTRGDTFESIRQFRYTRLHMMEAQLVRVAEAINSLQSATSEKYLSGYCSCLISRPGDRLSI